MEPLDPKVIILFFIKNILGTIYVIPIWWIGVSIFGAIWAPPPDLLPKAQVLLLLDGAGIIYLILLILGCYYWAWLTFSRYSFNLENDGLHIYQGVLIRRHIMIPYNSIQAVEVYINPLVMRFLRLYYFTYKNA